MKRLLTILVSVLFALSLSTFALAEAPADKTPAPAKTEVKAPVKVKKAKKAKKAKKVIKAPVAKTAPAPEVKK